MGMMGFKLFHISFTGILVISHTTHAKIVPTASPWKVSVANSIAMYITVMTNLNLGSSLWIILSFGKYCPNVISFNIICKPL
jgi:hypothetical protein